jgi:hypothetical protein
MTRYYKNNTLTASPTIPNILNPTQEQILDAGWFVYIDTPPAYNQSTQKLIKTEVIDGVQGYEVVELTPEEIRDMTVPKLISQLQGKLQLDLMELYLTVEAMIAQSGSQAKIYWNTAANWERDSPILNNLAPIIWPEDTNEKLDQFFIQASKLN